MQFKSYYEEQRVDLPEILWKQCHSRNRVIVCCKQHVCRESSEPAEEENTLCVQVVSV